MKLLLLSFYFFISILGYSQYNIKGRIIDKNNLPVEFANVIIRNTDSAIVKASITNENGEFSINNVERGTFRLSVNYFSINLYSKSFKIEKDVNLDTIIIEKNLTLGEVRINAGMTIRKEAGKYIVEDIGTSPLSKNKNTYDFLNSLPIVNTSSDGNALFIKNKNQAKILINGKEVGNNEQALNILKLTPAENITKIEVITNPGSKYSADNQDGIINVIIKKMDEGLRGALNINNNQSFYNSQSGGLSLTYSKKKWVVASGFRLNNYKNRIIEKSTFKDYYRANETQIISNASTHTQSIAPYININYDINSKQNIGIQVNSSLRNNNDRRTSSCSFNNLGSTILDSSHRTNILNKAPELGTLFLNANYKLKTDTIGSGLEINYYSYMQENKSEIINDLYYANQLQSIVQKPEIKTNFNSLVADYKKNFLNEDVLEFGIKYNSGIISNNFFYANYNGIDYIKDTLRSNNFEYSDQTFASYFTYQKLLGDNWESAAGLRLENYNGEGKSNSTQAVKQKNTYLFPFLSLVFYAHKNHEFSLDYNSSIRRPPYNYYNPNLYYISTNSYKRSNPSLLPILAKTLALNYSFFKHYSLDLEYDIAKNIFNDFDIIQPNGLIESITDNYGNGSSYLADFTYNNHFFKKRWSFTVSLSYIYDVDKGVYNNIDMGFTNNEYCISLKNFIYFNKKKDFYLHLKYGYNSSNISVLGEMNDMHSMILELNKSYKNWNFVIGAYDLLRPNLILKEDKVEYGFYKRRNYYKTAYINISYLFGNRKVKSISDKQSKDNDRLQ